MRKTLQIFQVILIHFIYFGLVRGDENSFDVDQQRACQSLKCNPLTEICRQNSLCLKTSNNKTASCFYCTPNRDENVETPFSSDQVRSQFVQGQHSIEQINKSTNAFEFDDGYDEYYEDDQEKTDLHEYSEYIEDYNEPIEEKNVDRSKIIKKLGVCPQIVEALGQCEGNSIAQPECQIDTNCPGDLKCCPVACGKRSCQTPVQIPIPNCPKIFHCSLNCPLGYRVDKNGCLVCQCQSCPSMEQCEKRCSTGFRKDLFNCDICECQDRCPPLICKINCPANVGFVQGENGCPLCQCAISPSKALDSTSSSCQKDVHCPNGFRCVNDERNVPMCQPESGDSNSLHAVVKCEKRFCQATCGPSGFVLDPFGCPTCVCLSKDEVRCSNSNCRMFCEYGFKHDENGCEYCACNEAPKTCPTISCQTSCKVYRKDFNDCPICQCDCPPLVCPLLKENCTGGFELGPDSCPICRCAEKKPTEKVRCPTNQCQLSCLYGFRRDYRNCELCECDWTPIDENIRCDEKNSCPGSRVCNLDLRLCEKVDADRVNWFMYTFDLHRKYFNNGNFSEQLKNQLIENIAAKYDLKSTQITVSSIESNGQISFQIMPFFTENLDEFEEKINQIDLDLNSHEFRTVLPSIVRAEEESPTKNERISFFKRIHNEFNRFTPQQKHLFLSVVGLFLLCVLILLTIFLVKIFRRPVTYSNLSDSKSPIYDAPYQKAPNDEDHYQPVEINHGKATYVAVPTEEPNINNEKRSLV